MLCKYYCIMALTILFASAGKPGYAQQGVDLIGDWKITKVEMGPDAAQEERQMLEMLTQIFLKSTFHFKNNSLFSFDSPDKDLAIQDAVWRFDTAKKYIKISERVSKGKPGQLMGIIVIVKEGKYFFQMEETPVILAVMKK
jgi:hypothetical protein